MWSVLRGADIVQPAAFRIGFSIRWGVLELNVLCPIWNIGSDVFPALAKIISKKRGIVGKQRHGAVSGLFFKDGVEVLAIDTLSKAALDVQRFPIHR